MNDLDYQNFAEALLHAVEANCDRINALTEADIDNQRVGGMVTMTFANKSQIIINLQKPLQEVWMAAKAGGFHYKYNSEQWRNHRDNTEFFSDLSLYSTQQSGMPLTFSF